jgi:tetraacyldisaccharide 4'-kinase
LADYEKVLKQLKNRYPNATLVCTEKDAVKLWTLQPQALTVTLELSLPNAFWVEFEKALKSLLNPL